MTASPALSRVAQLLEVFSIFADEGLNIASARAILFIGMASSDYESPFLPSVSDVATVIEMSHSGTSRLLSGLASDKNPFIGSDKGIKDSRSESFFLTDKGKLLLEVALGLFYKDKEANRLTPLRVETYAKAKYIDKMGYFGATLEDWLGAVVQAKHPGIDVIFSEDGVGKSFMFQATHCDTKVKDTNVNTYRFDNKSQAVLFMCKLGLPFRRKAKADT